MKQTTHPSIQPETLLAVVSALQNGGRPADDEPPHKPGPWDPVIRTALEKFFWKLFRENPLFGGGEPGNPGHTPVALNPQPLPPLRWALMETIAETVIERAEFMHEIAGATVTEAGKRGIIIVSGYVASFTSGLFKTEIKLPLAEIRRLWRPWCHCHCHPWHFVLQPIPRPIPPEPPEWPEWLHPELTGADLVTFGATFAEAAKRTFAPELRTAFTEAGVQLVEAGARQLQGS